MEEVVRSDRLMGLGSLEVGNVKRVGWKSKENVIAELFLIHNDCCTEHGSK